MTRAEVEIYEDEAGEHRWRLKAANGEIVATGEGHRDEHDAMRSFLRLEELAHEASHGDPEEPI